MLLARYAPEFGERSDCYPTSPLCSVLYVPYLCMLILQIAFSLSRLFLMVWSHQLPIPLLDRKYGIWWRAWAGLKSSSSLPLSAASTMTDRLFQLWCSRGALSLNATAVFILRLHVHKIPSCLPFNHRSTMSVRYSGHLLKTEFRKSKFCFPVVLQWRSACFRFWGYVLPAIENEFITGIQIKFKFKIIK